VKTNSSDLLKFGLVPLGIGVLSGFATSLAARLSSELDPFIGVFFGAAVIFLVWLKKEKCSARLITVLMASSVASYCAAIWGTLFITGRIGLILGYGTRFTELFGPVTFSIAGFLGALVFNLAILLLLSAKRGVWILGRAAAWALAGAFLGFLSAELADSVGVAVKAVIGVPRTGMGTDNSLLSMYSAYLIWQTGMCLLIPFMLGESATTESGQAVSAPRSMTGSSVPGKLFFGCILATVAVIGYFSVRDLYHTWKYHQKTALGETPSAVNLPEVERRPLEQMLIFREMGGYVDAGATRNIVSAHTVNTGPKGRPQELAERVVYRIAYENAESEPDAAEPQIMVTVSEFPNVDWARYQLKAGPASDGQRLYLASTRISRFGSPVLIFPTQSGSTVPASPLNQYVYWPSGNKVVVVYHSGQQAAEEVLKQYLAKYPSSL
jgi:hypothetical protein